MGTWWPAIMKIVRLNGSTIRVWESHRRQRASGIVRNVLQPISDVAVVQGKIDYTISFMDVHASFFFYYSKFILL
jgi:hypothetical protein